MMWIEAILHYNCNYCTHLSLYILQVLYFTNRGKGTCWQAWKMGNLGMIFSGNLPIWRHLFVFEIKKYTIEIVKNVKVGGTF